MKNLKMLEYCVIFARKNARMLHDNCPEKYFFLFFFLGGGGGWKHVLPVPCLLRLYLKVAFFFTSSLVRSFVCLVCVGSVSL